MMIKELDTIFPYVCFAYGVLMTLVLNSPVLVALAESRLPPPLVHQWKGHRVLGLVCLWVGGFWILQNLWLT
jgi:hypothetical protein